MPLIIPGGLASLTPGMRVKIQIQDGKTPMEMGVLTRMPYKHLNCLNPKPKQLQLYINSEVAEAIIDSQGCGKTLTAHLKHKLWNLTSKSGWVHFHTYNEFLSKFKDCQAKDPMAYKVLSRLQHLLHRAKVGRKST